MLLLIAAFFILSEGLSLVNPEQFYRLAITPSLVALYGSQRLVFVGDPRFVAGTGRSPWPAALLNLAAGGTLHQDTSAAPGPGCATGRIVAPSMPQQAGQTKGEAVQVNKATIRTRRQFVTSLAAGTAATMAAALVTACGSTAATTSSVTATSAAASSAVRASSVAATRTTAAKTSAATSGAATATSSASKAAAASTGSATSTAATSAVASSASANARAAGGEVSVLYYTSTNPAIQRMKKQQAAINQLLPQIKLTMIPINSNIDGKFTSMSAGGSPPDLSWMGAGFWQHAPAGELLALDGLMAQDKTIHLETYYPQATDLFRYQGHVDALAYGVNTHVMVYNKNMLRKAGVDFPKEDWTYNDFTTIAGKLTSGPQAQPRTYGEWMWNLWVNTWMFGGQFYDKDFTKSLIDQPAGVTALQFYYDQSYGKLLFAPQSGAYAKLFGGDQLAITHVGPFGVPVLRQYASLDWDFLPMPLMPDKKRGTWISGEGYGIAKGTKNQDGAWAVLKYLSGRDAMANFYAPEFQAIPAARDVAETAFVKAIPGKNAKAFLESIDFATAYGGNPVIMKWGGPIGAMWTAVQKGQKSATDAAKECAAQLDDLLKTVPGATAK